MTPEARAAFTGAAVEAVRQASGQGRLVTREDVLAALEADGAFLTPVGLAPEDHLPPPSDRDTLLAAVFEAAPGIIAFQSLSGQTVYHHQDLLSRTYARILDSKGSPLLLMAEEIRINSRDYPRPVPVELFEAPPFELTPEDIEQALRVMAADAAFQDITFTPTATGAVYLFSTLHLERGYAAFLAQRAESLAMNP
ncbi:hypothetical protein [Humidesulfovibrio sp.]